MRNIQRGPVLDVRAIGGLHVVILAWDFAAGQSGRQTGLLGFAIERTELRNGVAAERYFLRGIKRFKNKDQGLPPGTPVPTSEHPVQTFQWGDYTAKPATTYRYRVVPVYGAPKMLEPDDASATTVEITTEADDAAPATGLVRHQIHFNRGAAGSQAFARRFENVELDEDKPESDAMKWLSRGLFEALLAFIAEAKDSSYGLRAMLYEFRYRPVGLAFKRARTAGADIDIRYEAQSYKDENQDMIAGAQIKSSCKPQKSRGGIRHNKFIVLLKDNLPIAVWTGSTNISAGGLFGHSNVGHAVWGEGLAAAYLDYWNRLTAADVAPALLKTANNMVEATPGASDLPPAGRIMTVFSPRDSKEDVATLGWYANLLGRGGQRIACATFAFGLDDVLKNALLQDDGVLRYAVFDKRPSKEFEDGVSALQNTVIAAGAKLAMGDLENFRAERLTGFNRNLYIHDKFLVLDPLRNDPIVITGSANFSPASQYSNDENMLVIRGDKRVADIYFGEFLRVFDHLYSRYIVKILKEKGTQNPDAGYLKETWQEWAPGHFKPDSRKDLRRRYFLEE